MEGKRFKHKAADVVVEVIKIFEEKIWVKVTMNNGSVNYPYYEKNVFDELIKIKELVEIK